MTTEHFIDTEHGRIAYYTSSGEAGKPTLVFLHGLSSNHVTWDPIVAIAEKVGYSTIALDLRGHGLSDKSRLRELYRIPVMSDDLRLVLKKEDITNFVVVGYSYGAYVGMDFSISHPTEPKGLVIISANHVSPFRYHWFSLLSPVAHWVINLIGWLLVWQKRKKYYYFDPLHAPGYWKSTFAGYTTMPLSINFWMLSEVFSLDYAATIGKITCPTLIIRGENDAFITEAETNAMQDNIKGSRVVTLGLGHYVASHYQELVAARLLTFLAQLP